MVLVSYSFLITEIWNEKLTMPHKFGKKAEQIIILSAMTHILNHPVSMLELTVPIND